MNQTTYPDGAANTPWPTHDTRLLPSDANQSDAADRLRAARDAWAEDVRTTVRSNPLVSITGALAFGFVIARLIR